MWVLLQGFDDEVIGRTAGSVWQESKNDKRLHEEQSYSFRKFGPHVVGCNSACWESVKDPLKVSRSSFMTQIFWPICVKIIEDKNDGSNCGSESRR